jgi:SAM-dependent methyltransferase
LKKEIAPTAIYSDGEYLEHNKTWHAEDSPYKASFVADSIERNRVRFETCADIGCGAGLVTEILAEKYPNAEFVGYDFSKDAQKFWAQRKKLQSLSYRSEDFLESPQPVDLVVCLDVFEHVEDYFGFLRSLRTKGRNFVFNIPLDMNVLRVATPGIRYCRKEVGHLHYFNEYTAIETLKDCGYHVVDTKLSVAYLAAMPRNMKQWVVLPIRLLSIALGKSFAAKFFGGISLVVYARAD